ncbi:hypothetical protein BJP34_25575 [Moorena producens PAL-8-15-08-1]|uniref:Uncharacterized protein n=1 Tax=Moorena producens PAL-8-15-08-1 TaxID=1458985 RepID=A0A1D8TXJ2_9CYAN|nr:DUF3598 family protein [Moorena producens]AOX02362.1 hypothetical protein BJP34_25575 [Moorena producens PAL-8-15-08-1]
MELKEQNWKNFTANHLRDWHGIWTRYSPEGEIIESFQSLRSFRSNPEQTEIYQTNRSIYADGRIEEKKWQSNKQDKVLPDGIIHPALPSMRSFFFEQGAATWSAKQLEPGSVFQPAELFFKHENIRHSVAIIYESNGSLMRAVSIREDAAGFPSNYWSTEINLLPERNLSGNWQGTSVTMTPDLKVSDPISTQLHWPLAGNNMFFFPDGISLSCPKQVNIGKNFTIVANWLVTDSQLQQLRVNYDNYGAFSGLTLELLHL